MKCTLAGLAALLLAAPAMAQIYKCPDASGRTVIQQMPCAMSGTRVGDEIKRREEEKRAKLEAEKERQERAHAEQAEQAEQREREREREHRRYAMEEAETKATCQGKLFETPTIGMAEKVFLLCTATGRGRASAVNQTQTAAGVSKQYVYRSEYSPRSKYVYTRNGVVTAIQD